MISKQASALEKRKGRRSLLALMGVGGAAAAAALVSQRSGAEAGHDGSNVFHLGEDNTAVPLAATYRSADVDDAALAGVNINAGEFPIGVGGLASTPAATSIRGVESPDRALRDRTDQAKKKALATLADVRQGDVVEQQEGGNGVGVVGGGDLAGAYGFGGLIGVLGTTEGGAAVFGADDAGGIGALGTSKNGAGVRGEGKPGVLAVGTGAGGIGVKGTGRPGVYGVSRAGAGVRGDGTGAGSVGVLAKNAPGRAALRTKGKVEMNCARKKKLANKSNLITLPADVRAGTNAAVLATVQGNPGNDAVIWRAFRVDGRHIRIVFTKKPANRVPVAYWVVHTG